MARYRKRPLAVDAVQFTWEAGDASEFAGLAVHRDSEGPYVMVRVGRDFVVAGVGDWIVTDATGTQIPCKPDLFEATYERAE